MNVKKLLLSAFAAAVTAQAGAQALGVYDSVTMEANYKKDAFYSMQNGQQATTLLDSNTNWDLGFLISPQGAYGNVTVIANHVQEGVNVYSLHMQASTSFDALTPADTVGKTGDNNKIYNADTNWLYGAFNRMNDVTNPFDYSWGFYNLSTHNVVGDSLYLINTADGQYWKLWIQKYISAQPTDSIGWTFRIANLDGSNDQTVYIFASDYPNRNFAYYNVHTGAALNREPANTDWDILFTRYIENIPYGPGIYVPYPVTGVLSNFGVEVAEAHHVVPDTAQYQNYAFSTYMDAIGSDWKTFNMTTFTYEVDDSSTYFIHTLNNEYWQLTFTGFNSATGKIIFAKRQVFPSSTGIANMTSAINKYYIAPNPANNAANIMIDAATNAGEAQLTLTDMSGRTVQNSNITIKAGMNAFNVNTSSLPAGMYVLTVTGNGVALTQKLSVAH